MYITGDTLLVDDLKEIPRRYAALDVAVLHLGGSTLPGGFVVTMDGWKAPRRLGHLCGRGETAALT